MPPRSTLESPIFSVKVARSPLGPVVKLGAEHYLVSEPEFRGLAGFRKLFLRSQSELFSMLTRATRGTPISPPRLLNTLEPTKTTILGAGVTFSNSLRERRLETMRAGSLVDVTDDGRPTPYDVVYDPANPPEVFFKAIQSGHLAKHNELWIRPDGAPNAKMGSSVPEPERVLLVNHLGEIIAETIGSDTTARQLESLSPLYLPAAKTYPGCTTLCPWFTVFNSELPREIVKISMEIIRKGKTVYLDSYTSDQMKRTPESLVKHARTLAEGGGGHFKHGFALFTGTGIIPPIEFSLSSGDLVIIDSPQLGRLEAKTRVIKYTI